MKKINLYLIAAALFTLAGCDDNRNFKPENKKIGRYETPSRTKTVAGYVIEMDGCEYLTGTYYESRWVAHKGNCKFCLERAKQDK